MEIVADAALKAGGTVVGVMPRSLVEREIAHRGLHQLHVVETMHERKTKFAELADAFLALPGGAGTLEEIFGAGSGPGANSASMPSLAAFSTPRVTSIPFGR